MAKKSSVPVRLRRQVQERAQGRCEYCLIHELDAYYSHEPDHVIAEKHGGPTTLDNLAWSCSYCNRFKGSDIASIDPISHRIVPLFNPRTQKWNRHFRFNVNLIEGITASGRATVTLLHMNDTEQIDYRSF
jgi:5-methylcytosine-specific restriction endonuclease McrA